MESIVLKVQGGGVVKSAKKDKSPKALEPLPRYTLLLVLP